MPRPETNKECLHYVNCTMQHSEEVISIVTKKLVLEMLQQNAELTDCITAASVSFATVFARKLKIKPTTENIKEIIADDVFMNGIAPVIKGLIKADEEARNE